MAGDGGDGNAAQAARRAADAASHDEAVVGPFRRLHDDRWMDWIGFDRPKPEWNASDAHGPGGDWGGAWAWRSGVFHEVV